MSRTVEQAYQDLLSRLESTKARLDRELAQAGRKINSLERELAATRSQLASETGKLRVVGRTFTWASSLIVVLLAAILSNPTVQQTIWPKPSQSEPLETAEIFLLPASRPWLNTGIEFEGGESFTIQASGAVHLAYHRMLLSAIADTVPRKRWIHILEGDESDLTGIDDRRPSMFGPNHGSIVLYFHDNARDRAPPTDVKPWVWSDDSFAQDVDEGYIQEIATLKYPKTTQSIDVPGSSKVILYVTVNDSVPLNYENFVGAPKGEPAVGEREWVEEYRRLAEREESGEIWKNDSTDAAMLRFLVDRWIRFGIAPPGNPSDDEVIQFFRNRYRYLEESGALSRLWYDDNIGAFLITVRRRI